MTDCRLLLKQRSKMKNKYVVINCISIICILSLLLYNVKSRLNNATIIEKNDRREIINGIIKKYNNGSLVTVESSGEALFYEHNYNKIKFKKDILEKIEIKNLNNYIFFRFSYSNCQACLDLELLNILQLQKEIRNPKIIILGSFYSDTDFNLFQQTYIKTISVIKIPRDYFDIPIEKIDVPYFFKIDANLKTTKVFYPDTNSPELSFQWLKKQ